MIFQGVVYMTLPQRKQNRIPNYDYSQCGAYFITVCVADRKPVLSTIDRASGQVLLLPYGRILEKYIRNAPEVEKYVIMPDHAHLIVRLDISQGIAFESEKSTGSRVASIVRSIKILTTKEIGVPIFQRSYYDHVIRNQAEYNEKWEYIDNNPKKWTLKQQGEI